VTKVPRATSHCNLALSDVQHGVRRRCREDQLKLMV